MDALSKEHENVYLQVYEYTHICIRQPCVRRRRSASKSWKCGQYFQERSARRVSLLERRSESGNQGIGSARGREEARKEIRKIEEIRRDGGFGDRDEIMGEMVGDMYIEGIMGKMAGRWRAKFFKMA